MARHWITKDMQLEPTARGVADLLLLQCEWKVWIDAKGVLGELHRVDGGMCSL